MIEDTPMVSIESSENPLFSLSFFFLWIDFGLWLLFIVSKQMPPTLKQSVMKEVLKKNTLKIDIIY